MKCLAYYTIIPPSTQHCPLLQDFLHIIHIFPSWLHSDLYKIFIQILSYQRNENRDPFLCAEYTGVLVTYTYIIIYNLLISHATNLISLTFNPMFFICCRNLLNISTLNYEISQCCTLKSVVHKYEVPIYVYV